MDNTKDIKVLKTIADGDIIELSAHSGKVTDLDDARRQMSIFNMIYDQTKYGGFNSLYNQTDIFQPYANTIKINPGYGIFAGRLLKFNKPFFIDVPENVTGYIYLHWTPKADLSLNGNERFAIIYSTNANLNQNINESIQNKNNADNVKYFMKVASFKSTNLVLNVDKEFYDFNRLYSDIFSIFALKTQLNSYLKIDGSKTMTNALLNINATTMRNRSNNYATLYNVYDAKGTNSNYALGINANNTSISFNEKRLTNRTKLHNYYMTSYRLGDLNPKLNGEGIGSSITPDGTAILDRYVPAIRQVTKDTLIDTILQNLSYYGITSMKGGYWDYTYEFIGGKSLQGLIKYRLFSTLYTKSVLYNEDIELGSAGYDTALNGAWDLLDENNVSQWNGTLVSGVDTGNNTKYDFGIMHQPLKIKTNTVNQLTIKNIDGSPNNNCLINFTKDDLLTLRRKRAAAWYSEWNESVYRPSNYFNEYVRIGDVHTQTTDMWNSTFGDRARKDYKPINTNFDDESTITGNKAVTANERFQIWARGPQIGFNAHSSGSRTNKTPTYDDSNHYATRPVKYGPLQSSSNSIQCIFGTYGIAHLYWTYKATEKDFGIQDYNTVVKKYAKMQSAKELDYSTDAKSGNLVSKESINELLDVECADKVSIYLEDTDGFIVKRIIYTDDIIDNRTVMIDKMIMKFNNKSVRIVNNEKGYKVHKIIFEGV